MGTVTTAGADTVVLRMHDGSLLQLYTNTDSRIWHGKWGNNISLVKPGDQVVVRYQRNPSGHLMISDLYDNIEHIWGQVTNLTRTGIKVLTNPNADPQSAYQRRVVDIIFGSDTKFQSSTAKDIRVGRFVDIIALRMPNELQAVRVIVYDGHVPVELLPGTPMVPSNGHSGQDH